MLWCTLRCVIICNSAQPKVLPLDQKNFADLVAGIQIPYYSAKAGRIVSG
jgi:hypothetical protein